VVRFLALASDTPESSIDPEQIGVVALPWSKRPPELRLRKARPGQASR
jgi:hypothetical protein